MTGIGEIGKGDEDDVSVEEAVALTRWVCDHYLEFFANFRLETLEPDRFPEDRIIVDLIRRKAALLKDLWPEDNSEENGRCADDTQAV